MRGTMKITNSTSLLYLQRNYAALEKVTNQISATAQVVNLEDDPMASVISMNMRLAISRTEQYSRNIEAGLGILTLTDKSLNQDIKKELDKIRTLVVGAANGPTTPEQRTANAIELNEILRKLVSAANTYDGERYIYGGQYTKSTPFNIVNGRYVNYLGDDKLIKFLTDFSASQAVNCTGSAAFGNMTTIIKSRDYNPDVTLATDRSTRLSDLNGGNGVPKGKIMVYYSAYPEGLEVDLSSCYTLEDVKDAIEKQTLDASKKLDASKDKWLDYSNLNWRDLQDRYVKVTVNPEHNGISLQEFDLGEPLPPPNKYEAAAGLAYNDFGGAQPGYAVGGYGVGGATKPAGELTVYNQDDAVYGNGTKPYSALRVEDFANNKVAEGLGIKGSANKYNPAKPDPVLDGFLHGRDLNPALSDRTLLADLEGYNDAVYTFNNGSKPSSISINETSQDPNNIFNAWNLNGQSKGKNTGPNGELYAKVSRRGAPDNDMFVELYTVPIDKAKPSDLVATGSYTASQAGGTVIMKEANSSGISGTVGIVLSTSTQEAKVNLSVDFGTNIQASVHVPAFVDEVDENGMSKDKFNIASGWQIRGLDKPPAKGYDENHPASTDLDGDISVNYRYNNGKFIVELYRPSFNNQPAKLIATGTMDVSAAAASSPSEVAASGRIELVGAPGFEGVKGSVYIELPVGTTFENSTTNGNGQANATQFTYQLASDAPAGTVILGGAMEVATNSVIGAPYTLSADTVFKAGQRFDTAVILPNGGRIAAGTTITEDIMIPKGVTVRTDVLQAGTVLQAGQEISFSNAIATGTVIPRGTYYTSGGAFPAAGMGITVTDPTGTGLPVSVIPAGYDLRATFATIEDFNRAVEEAGVYVTSRVAADGKSLEFISSLAGAYLTVSEDTDCYEQMNDKYQQLSGLDLTGLVKGVNADSYGNTYTEVIYYPPDPTNPAKKIQLISDDGKIVEVDPGYYVRVYSDKSALNKTYENRDNSTMVAEGYLAPGQWNPAYTETIPLSGVSPFLPAPPATTLGTATGLVLQERNNSGVSGTVNLDYYGNQSPQARVDTRINPKTGATEQYVNYDPWKNDNITNFPGGLRPEGSRHTTIQQWDMVSITPGVTCDYAGTYHGKIARDDTTASKVSVTLHRDASHSVVTARNDPTEPLGPGNVVQLYETEPDGKFILVNGNKVPAGTMVVDYANLPDGSADKFTLTTGATRQYGQEREENVFSTINDILDAMVTNNEEMLGNLIEDNQRDIDRLLRASGDVGARSAVLTLLADRHADEILSYTTMFTKKVGMDTDALSAAIVRQYGASNAYDAAMKVAGSIMQVSLLDYLR